jgi:transcriptional regulator with XRE-family HTH domain
MRITQLPLVVNLDSVIQSILVEDEAHVGRQGPRTAEHVLGTRVSELRRARGWPQEELARRMRDAGFTWRQTTVAKTEKADRPVRVNEAAALARLFETTIEQLTTPGQPLIDRLEKARQELIVLEADAKRAALEAEQKGAQQNFLRNQVEAIEALIVFWREQTVAALTDAVPRVRNWSPGWLVLLAEAGIPREVAETAEQKAADQFKSTEPPVEEPGGEYFNWLVAMNIVEWFKSSGGGEDHGKHPEAS